MTFPSFMAYVSRFISTVINSSLGSAVFAAGIAFFGLSMAVAVIRRLVKF